MNCVNYLWCSKCNCRLIEQPTSTHDVIEHGCGRQDCCTGKYKCERCHSIVFVRLNAPDMDTGERN